MLRSLLLLYNGEINLLEKFSHLNHPSESNSHFNSQSQTGTLVSIRTALDASEFMSVCPYAFVSECECTHVSLLLCLCETQVKIHQLTHLQKTIVYTRLYTLGTHTHTCTHIYIYIYIYMCVCVCVYTSTNAYIYKLTLIYIYTHSQSCIYS